MNYILAVVTATVVKPSKAHLVFVLMFVSYLNYGMGIMRKDASKKDCGHLLELRSAEAKINFMKYDDELVCKENKPIGLLWILSTVRSNYNFKEIW